MPRIQRIKLDSQSRAQCPVCRNPVYYVFGVPGEDVTDGIVPDHSEGLTGSGRRCYAVGLEGTEAAQLRDDREEDPRLPLRAHP